MGWPYCCSKTSGTSTKSIGRMILGKGGQVRGNLGAYAFEI